jgi:RNA polymerase sigma factor (sigma-70 family)
MANVRDGDVGQLGVLFERHHERLYNFFLRLTSNRSASEDLVQEVFLRILKYRHTYRAESEFRFWLYQIARNARADYFRKWKGEAPLPESDDLASHERSASDVLAESQDFELVRQALAKLPDDKREVLVLSRYQHMKYEEIAQLLDCTVGTVKVRVHRAMKDLREAYFRLSKDRVS